VVVGKVLKKMFNFGFVQLKVELCKNKTKSNKLKSTISQTRAMMTHDVVSSPCPSCVYGATPAQYGQVWLCNQHNGRQGQDHSMALRSEVADSASKKTFIFIRSFGH
jgi:hypothetical protein